MSTHEATVVHAGDNQTTWRGAGDEYRVLVTGKETTGEYFIMEASVPPGRSRSATGSTPIGPPVRGFKDPII